MNALLALSLLCAPPAPSTVALRAFRTADGAVSGSIPQKVWSVRVIRDRPRPPENFHSGLPPLLEWDGRLPVMTIMVKVRSGRPHYTAATLPTAGTATVMGQVTPVKAQGSWLRLFPEFASSDGKPFHLAIRSTPGRERLTGPRGQAEHLAILQEFLDDLKVAAPIPPPEDFPEPFFQPLHPKIGPRPRRTTKTGAKVDYNGGEIRCTIERREMLSILDASDPDPRRHAVLGQQRPPELPIPPVSPIILFEFFKYMAKTREQAYAPPTPEHYLPLVRMPWMDGSTVLYVQAGVEISHFSLLHVGPETPAGFPVYHLQMPLGRAPLSESMERLMRFLAGASISPPSGAPRP